MVVLNKIAHFDEGHACVFEILQKSANQLISLLALRQRVQRQHVLPALPELSQLERGDFVQDAAEVPVPHLLALVVARCLKHCDELLVVEVLVRLNLVKVFESQVV